MKRIILMLTVAAFMVAALTVTAAGAFAAAPTLPAGCEKVKGQIVCTTTTSGKNEKQPKFQETTTTTTQGNLTNFSPEPQGTGTTETCGKPCPPGQFK
jgi:hypothetical protein